MASPSDPNLYLLGVFFSAGIIWTSGPQPVDSGASLSLLSNGNLRLINGSGAQVWESGTANMGVSSATLEESGNFILRNSSSSIWETFKNPTDTIMKDQNFTLGMKLTSGSYSFSLNKTGNLTLTWQNNVTYWSEGLNSTFARNLSNPVLSLGQEGLLILSDPSFSPPVTMAYSNDYAESADIIRLVRLDSDGNLRSYSSPRTTTSLNPQWSAVEDQCKVYGYCGNMGICTYNDTNPICICPSQDFDPVDPNDSRKGCKRKLELAACSGNTSMLPLDHTEFFSINTGLRSQTFFMGVNPCRLNCLVDSTCQFSTSLGDGSGQCLQMLSNFVSGYQSPNLPSTSFVKICGAGIPNQSLQSHNQNKIRASKLTVWVVLLVVLVTILALVAIETGLWFCFCRNNKKFGALSAQYALLEYASGAPVQFSYKELQKATKGFKEKLGAGGFGAVYRGVLANNTVVAVKRLEGIEQGEKQFRMEVATISSTHHLNLVRLIGFCSEGKHRLLVYEFMKNGSLDCFLFHGLEALVNLDWEARFNIALGTARGITYLHEECRDCIVHCDIKPENILLDDNNTAKVSDFGLAKLINPKDHRFRTLTSVRGTRGYLAPEWLANLPITSKSDVYSYGMVLLETIGGRRNFDVSEETGHKKFSMWAYEEFDSGRIESIVDKRLGGEVDMEQLSRAIQVSFWCIQEQPSQRPIMGKVVQMLEGITNIERPPAPKAREGNVSIVSGVSSATSTTLASAPPTSPSSSLLAVRSSASRRNTEKLPSFTFSE
ncbi:hypothetical protein AMTR_s00017p00139310 [Amborella trichopoda]|uniref:Receptor-like serine/threonine-protein kinase n=2 Tax=Amborella trichopoda TaxID=13333 RepID=W1PN32_AMBTC|nr:hypothetical protein AMTR_s00017p00139310 [Amborella trichopoda]